MSQMDSKPDGIDKGFDGLVSLESVPPPAADGIDVHAARTAIGTLDDAVLEELKRGSRSDALTRRMSPFVGPFPGQRGEDAFTDEAPTAPGQLRAPLPAAGAPAPPAAPPLALNRIPTPMPIPVAEPEPAPRVPTLPPPDVRVTPVVQEPAVAAHRADMETPLVAATPDGAAVVELMPKFRRFSPRAGVVAVFIALALAVAAMSLLSSLLT